MQMRLGSLEFSHWPEVRRIYLEGIASGHATFETEAPDWPRWDSEHLPHSRLIAIVDESVAGWAALSPVSRRSVYAGVAEVSVYVAAEHRGRGIGKALLRELISKADQNGIWTLQASIFPENETSIALHLDCGFCEVGRRQKIAQLNGVWRDTLLLERRTKK